MAGLKFEQAMKRLEEIVTKMEGGELTLDESLKLFEEGIGLTRALNKQLEQAEQKVEVLMKDESGKLKTAPFEGTEEG